MLASLPLQGVPSLGAGDLNPAQITPEGMQRVGGATATSGTGKLGRLAAPSLPLISITPNAGIRLLRSWRMGNRGSKAWTPLRYQQPPFHLSLRGITET